MRLDALIFDCDGTLVDSERLGVEVLAQVAAAHGASFEVDGMLEKLRGQKMATCVARIQALTGVVLPESFVPEVRRRTTLELEQRLQPMDGALELVRSLQIPFCVASSAPRDKIELSLSITGLLPFFTDRIFSSYEVGTWKPDPGLFLHAAAALGIDPAVCGVVEDSRPGVKAGIAAGMFVFKLAAVGHSNEQARVRRVPTLRHLKQLLEALPSAE